MIFLEQTVNQVLLEEGQTIITFEDLQITWESVEQLFIGVYEQAKKYIAIYDWFEDTLSTSKQQRPQYSHIKHLTYNAFNGMQRLMPDAPGQYWEFNPYTKNMSSLVNTNFAIEAGRYPTLENLEYTIDMDIKKEKKKHFSLPCTFNPQDLTFGDFVAYEKDGIITLESNNGVGSFNNKTLNGYIIMDKDYKAPLTVTSKYVGIKELDMSCEIFYVWFKAVLMQYLGAMKKQLDLTGVGLPFDINADGLLERGRQLLDSVEELKGTKSTWSNF